MDTAIRMAILTLILQMLPYLQILRKHLEHQPPCHLMAFGHEDRGNKMK